MSIKFKLINKTVLMLIILTKYYVLFQYTLKKRLSILTARKRVTKNFQQIKNASSVIRSNLLTIFHILKVNYII